jgi:hypothetical protein
MAIAVDVSSPALVIGTATSLQTSTFSPPSGSILVTCVLGDSGRNSWTITTTVATGVTWTNIFHAYPAGIGSADAYWGYLPSGATNMAVTAAGATPGGTDNTMGLKVYVVTGADIATPVGAVSTGGSTADTANVLAHSIVPQVASSLGIMVAEEFENLGVSTSPDTTFTDSSAGGSSIGGGMGYRVMGAAGGTETFTFDAFGTAAANWAWGVFEIRAAPTGGAVTNKILTHMTARQRASLW